MLDLIDCSLVVGEKEQSNGTVNVRTRDNKQHGEFSVADVLDKFRVLAAERVLKSEEHGWGAVEETVNNTLID